MRTRWILGTVMIAALAITSFFPATDASNPAVSLPGGGYKACICSSRVTNTDAKNDTIVAPYMHRFEQLHVKCFGLGPDTLTLTVYNADNSSTAQSTHYFIVYPTTLDSTYYHEWFLDIRCEKACMSHNGPWELCGYPVYQGGTTSGRSTITLTD